MASLGPVLLLTLAGCSGLSDPGAGPVGPPSAATEPSATTGSSTPSAAASPGVRPSNGTALAALGRLRVAGRGTLTGYSRGVFGPAWADTDRNGCDTRNDILRRDLVQVVLRPGTRDCTVLSGVRVDPYTGRRIAFHVGEGRRLDIDHVVALANAWVSGAARWPYARQIAFANDPLELLAVSSGANRQKGAGDAATWLPPNKAFRCAYVAQQIGVKAKYDLSVTPAERSAMAGVLAGCPRQSLPTGGTPTTSTVLPPRPSAT